jgi:hypothetical protein
MAWALQEAMEKRCLLPAVEIFHISLDPGDIMDAAHCAVVGNSA